MTIVTRVVAIFKGAAAEVRYSPPTPTIDFEVQFDDGFVDDQESAVEKPNLECIGRSFGIVYADSRGRGSTRRITIRSLAPQKSDLLVRAFCHERQAARSFKASRIEQIVDLRTGEIVDNATEFLARYLSKDPTFEALRNSGPGLQVLTFMAHCDEEFHPSELNCIIDYVESRAEAPIDYDAVSRHVEGLHPDSETFDRGLDILAEQGTNELKDISSWLHRLVNADGVLHEEEFHWLIEAEELLKSATD